MEIPANLVHEIKRGNVVLFLGAGAAMGAKSPDGGDMLGVWSLIKELADRFLGGSAEEYSLTSASELSISESDLVTVQGFIRDIFIPFDPAGFHLKIPSFKWKSIYTTNYDLVIEKAYSSNESSLQNLVPIYSSKDRVDSLVRSDSDLPYVKLHGCITKIDEVSPPLILTVDQYVTHREQRESLFQRLKEIGSSNTIVFVGHSLEDVDIRQILHEIAQNTSSRPRFYAVMPVFQDMQSRMWEGKRVTLLKGTFEEFLISLDESISNIEREIVFSKRTHEIERKFTSNDFEITPNTLTTLNSQLIYVTSSMPAEDCNPPMFYHGYSKDWGSIQQNLDIPRRLADEIISQVFLCDEHEKASQVELFLISGSAGSGKSIILKRVAWDSACDYEKVCFFWDSDEKIDVNAILELAEKVGERVFLFVDRPAMRVPDLMYLIDRLKRAKLPVSILLAERTNEWNIECQALHNHQTDVFNVRYLSHKEIGALVDKLEKHNCLGALTSKSREEQIEAFNDRAGRQLLVALHEATMAKSFEEIIFDEYQNIVPEKAKLIYRTICVMNRLGVRVRAGIISRIHGVSFEDFQEKFFSPLENIVATSRYHSTFDFSYEARHPSIAEMVFCSSLTKEDERFDIYVKLISTMDIGFSADRTAFRELIKYRNLCDLFNDLSKIDTIYSTAYKVCGEDDFLYQQMAIFSMKSSRRDFKKAEEFLYKAEKAGPHNRSIKHTRAELELARAQNAHGLDRERLYNKTVELAVNLTGKNSDSSHGYDTLCKVSILRLEDAIAKDDDELITEATKKAEEAIRTALQIYPDDEHILSQDAKLAHLLSDNKRALRALEKAFSTNPANAYLGARLSSIYAEFNDIESAKTTLQTLLSANPTDKMAHAKMGNLLSQHEPNSNLEAEYHWQRSFTDGDVNYLNQLWYARQLYINNKYDDYLKLITKLRSIGVPPKTRHKVRGLIKEPGGEVKVLEGKCIRKESTYALFESNGYPGLHFLHRSNCPDTIWDKIDFQSKIDYKLGFNFAGAAAVITDFGENLDQK